MKDDLNPGKVGKADHAICKHCGKEFFMDNSKSVYFCNTQCACDHALHKAGWREPPLEVAQAESGAVLNDW